MMTRPDPPPRDDSEAADTTRLVAFTEAPFRIERSPVEVVLTPIPSADGVTSPLAQIRTASRILLRVSDMEAPGRAGSYDVYVDVPPGAQSKDHPERFAGRISLFGPPRPPRKFNFVLDISRLRDTLAAALDEGGDRVRITIVPVYDWSDPVTVDCVSLHLV